MSESSGVYVRVQNTDGVLWSSSRDDWAEVIADLDSAFGPEYREWLITSLTGTAKPRQATVHAPAPAPAPAPVAPPTLAPAEAEAMAAVEEVFGAVAVEDEPQGQFESCEVCGHPKDKWNPPGISRNGKKYPGFFGCANFRNHPRR